jgi:hypothetical protein
MWLRNPRIQRLLGGGRIERWLIGLLARVELVGLSAHKEPAVLNLVREMRCKHRSLSTAHESYLIHTIALAQSRLDCSMAEVGVYEGGSARMICEGKGIRALHLFDTFEGLPESATSDKRVHIKSQYRSSFDRVQNSLKGYQNVHLHKGCFPASSGPVESLRFSFVNLDVDLYQSTLDCLHFFYPRMSSGGIMLSHDYSVLAGVRQAFSEFLLDKPEDVIELPTTQCMLIKR